MIVSSKVNQVFFNSNNVFFLLRCISKHFMLCYNIQPSINLASQMIKDLESIVYIFLTRLTICFDHILTRFIFGDFFLKTLSPCVCVCVQVIMMIFHGVLDTSTNLKNIVYVLFFHKFATTNKIEHE
jgi:hypothetical protein